ncbi:adenosine deaminase [Clostridium sp. LBM24168]
MNLDKLLLDIPKTDLHCHLDGSIRPSTMIDIAKKDKIKIPTYEINKFKQYTGISGKCSSLKEYLDKFNIPIEIMQNYENIYRITLELLEDSAKLNIKYIEIRFAPFNHTKNLSAYDVIKAALEAIKYGFKKYGIMSTLILCAMRHEPPEVSLKLTDIAKDFLGMGVTAIDLAGNEDDFPPEIHKKAFEMAKYYGLHRTVHAGETGKPENIIKSIELLNAERIGHGVFAFKDKSVVKYLKDHNIPLEMCITSNVNTSAVFSYKSHPIKLYLDNGLFITVNTDNTTVSNTTIIDEFKYLVKYQNFTCDDIKRAVKNGITASFLEGKDKKKLQLQLSNFLKNWDS